MGTVQGGRPCPLPHLHLGGRKDIRGWVDSNMRPPRGSDQGTSSLWMNVDGPEGMGGALRGPELLPRGSVVKRPSQVSGLLPPLL